MEPISGVESALSVRRRCSLRCRSASHRSYQQGRGRGVVLPEGLLVMYVFSEERTGRGLEATRWRRMKSCGWAYVSCGSQLRRGDGIVSSSSSFSYSNEPRQDQREEEAEEDRNWSRLDPFPERRRELQQGCCEAHFLSTFYATMMQRLRLDVNLI